MEKDEEFNKKFREAVNKFVADKNEAAFEVLDRQHSFLSARGVVLAEEGASEGREAGRERERECMWVCVFVSVCVCVHVCP